MSFTNIVRHALAQLRYPDIDANGNLNSPVTLRSASLSTLLAITDAGIGEIAVADNEDCIVVYEDNGAGNSLGKPTFRSGYSAVYNVGYSQSNIAQNTPTDIDITGGLSLPGGGLIDAANNYITTPSYVTGAGSKDILIVSFKPTLLIYGLAANANVTLDLQWWNGATWASIDSNNKVSGTANGSGTLALRGEQYAVFTAGNVTNKQRFKMVINQDGADAVNTLASSTALITLSQATYI